MTRKLSNGDEDETTIEQIQEDDMILAEKNGEKHFVPAVVVEKHYGYTGEMVEITLEKGKVLKATPTHSMIVGKKQEILLA